MKRSPNFFPANARTLGAKSQLDLAQDTAASIRSQRLGLVKDGG
jgi:hypothetical protein